MIQELKEGELKRSQNTNESKNDDKDIAMARNIDSILHSGVTPEELYEHTCADNTDPTAANCYIHEPYSRGDNIRINSILEGNLRSFLERCTDIDIGGKKTIPDFSNSSIVIPFLYKDENSKFEKKLLIKHVPNRRTYNPSYYMGTRCINKLKRYLPHNFAYTYSWFRAGVLTSDSPLPLVNDITARLREYGVREESVGHTNDTDNDSNSDEEKYDSSTSRNSLSWRDSENEDEDGSDPESVSVEIDSDVRSRNSSVRKQPDIPHALALMENDGFIPDDNEIDMRNQFEDLYDLNLLKNRGEKSIESRELLEFSDKTSTSYVITEYVEGETLQTLFDRYVKKKQIYKKTGDDESIIEIERQICSILFQLALVLYISQRQCSFIHGDLKPSHVIVKKLDGMQKLQYAIDEKTIYTISTNVAPVIIDYKSCGFIKNGVPYGKNDYASLHFGKDLHDIILTLLVTTGGELSNKFNIKNYLNIFKFKFKFNDNKESISDFLSILNGVHSELIPDKVREEINKFWEETPLVFIEWIYKDYNEYFLISRNHSYLPKFSNPLVDGVIKEQINSIEKNIKEIIKNKENKNVDIIGLYESVNDIKLKYLNIRSKLTTYDRQSLICNKDCDLRMSMVNLLNLYNRFVCKLFFKQYATISGASLNKKRGEAINNITKFFEGIGEESIYSHYWKRIENILKGNRR